MFFIEYIILNIYNHVHYNINIYNLHNTVKLRIYSKFIFISFSFVWLIVSILSYDLNT